MEIFKKISLQDLYQLMTLNFLWIAYTVAGLGIFGILPATYALYSSLYRLMNGDEQGSVGKEFYQTFKKNFFKMNLLLLPVLLILLILATDYYFSVRIQSKLLLFVILFLMYYACSIFHLFSPLKISQETTIKETLKVVGKMPFLLPKEMFPVFLYYVVVLLLGMIYPGFFAAFLFNIPSLLTMKAYLKYEKKVQEKKVHPI